jgi:hypothetical protein
MGRTRDCRRMLSYALRAGGPCRPVPAGDVCSLVVRSGFAPSIRELTKGMAAPRSYRCSALGKPVILRIKIDPTGPSRMSAIARRTLRHRVGRSAVVRCRRGHSVVLLWRVRCARCRQPPWVQEGVPRKLFAGRGEPQGVNWPTAPREPTYLSSRKDGQWSYVITTSRTDSCCGSWSGPHRAGLRTRVRSTHVNRRFRAIDDRADPDAPPVDDERR